MFDVRTDARMPASVHNLQRTDLFCHVFISEDVMALGYGDGTIALFDWRKPQLYERKLHLSLSECRFLPQFSCFFGDMTFLVVCTVSLLFPLSDFYLVFNNDPDSVCLVWNCSG